MRATTLAVLLSAAVIAIAVAWRMVPVERTVDRALIHLERDPDKRALVIAAGAGRVADVRSLLTRGVRADPEALAAAITGPFEPIYSWSGCERHAAVVRLLLAANPQLHLGDAPRSVAARAVSRLRRCPEVEMLLAQRP